MKSLYRWLSMLLALVLCMTMLPMGALADVIADNEVWRGSDRK